MALIAGLFVVLIILFVVLVVVTVVRANTMLRASAEWPTTPGEIVAIRRSTTMTPNVGASTAAGLPAGSIMTPETHSRPIVRYVDAGGQVHQGRALRVRGVGRLGIGHRVVVAYDPERPTRAVIRGIVTG